MATSAKNSEEQAIQIEASKSQSPGPDSTVPAQNDDEEKSIANEAADEEQSENDQDIWEAEKAGEGYFVPIYIWCASIIFPLCAGSFGPMASAFGVCALAGSWRIDDVTKATDNMLVGAEIKDPKW
jgi:potassium channel subfamily K